MRTGWALILAVALGAGGAACAKARAEVVTPDGPPLQVPDPPGRVLVPLEELVSAPPPPAPEEPPPPAPPRTPPRTAAERPQPVPAPPPPAVPAAPRDLRTTSTAPTAESERTVRDTLARAARDISQVEYGRLSLDGRAQYDQSKRFSAQAEQALRERNLVFAATLADKAASLAAELLGR
jgi:2-oxoglutarate dehydrogenase E2 component (dihydrolipoamide succinyltransferase)